MCSSVSGKGVGKRGCLLPSIWVGGAEEGYVEMGYISSPASRVGSMLHWLLFASHIGMSCVVGAIVCSSGDALGLLGRVRGSSAI